MFSYLLRRYSFLFYRGKVVQTECRTTSLLDCYAEVQPILCKDRNFFSYTGKFFSYTMKTAWILCLRAWLPTVLATVLIKLLIQNSKSRTARQLYIGFPFGRRTLFLNRRSRQFFILHSTFFIHLPPPRLSENDSLGCIIEGRAAIATPPKPI